MNVLLTGGAGTVGTAITDHLADREEYQLTSVDPEPHPDPNVESVEADVGDYDAIRPHFEDQDAVVHLAHAPIEGGGPSDRSIHAFDGHLANLEIHANAYEAAVDAGVDTFVYASSNHAVGMYEVEHAPDVYYPDYGLTVDHTVQPRPDSMYGVEKVYAEGLGRLAAEAHDMQVYALRICAVRDPEYDHPYGDAEAGVDRGEFERDSDAYATQVARMKGMWQSRRDHAQMVERCFTDDSVEFDVFYGVSDNDRRWFDVDHAREVLGYEPEDNGEQWDTPPE
ncbi:Nucleoside-diphosphate-sugar epimerase [Halomicrobium zhouii]|uniref:Nucleoside-diphosphate-sugar epimerase n=1 Tax=Halomicrobium zhouii TaxID=767519 RepID=A0A1I6KYY8_9EURY|nr:NAD(P)-dependent oxidoreductase [Halomicrobium zhouii]SFR96463.1 Nucleoside-diphosphate-sugar epimerase [Halomicrobium zhouii]